MCIDTCIGISKDCVVCVCLILNKGRCPEVNGLWVFPLDVISSTVGIWVAGKRCDALLLRAQTADLLAHHSCCLWCQLICTGKLICMDTVRLWNSHFWISPCWQVCIHTYIHTHKISPNVVRITFNEIFISHFHILLPLACCWFELGKQFYSTWLNGSKILQGKEEKIICFEDNFHNKFKPAQLIPLKKEN